MHRNQSRQSRTSATWMERRHLLAFVGAVVWARNTVVPGAQANAVVGSPGDKAVRRRGSVEGLARARERG